MLRKRTRPANSHQMADSSFSSGAVTPKGRGSSFFSVPGLLVGLSTKGSSDSESARSPTSPLEYRSFPNLGGSFAGSPRSPGLDGGNPRSWDCSKVGLGLVDSLTDEIKPCGKLLGISLSKNILFGSQVKFNMQSPKSHIDAVKDDPLGRTPKSLPKDFGISSRIRGGSPDSPLRCSKMAIGSGIAEVQGTSELAKIHSCCSTELCGSSTTLDQLMYPNLKSMSEVFSSDSRDSQMECDDYSGSVPMPIDSPYGLMESLSASDIELSEDYTCIISHGPNPKTTHIFGDRIFETHNSHSPSSKIETGKEGRSSWIVECSGDSSKHPSDDFLNLCFSCKKKLEGEDIYIYRGEKAFCSSECRDKEILIEEEEMQKPVTELAGSPHSFSDEDMYLGGVD